VAVQFPLAHPAITSVVVGTGSAARITSTLQALQTPIPSALWADLRAEGLLHKAAPVPQ
jgi:D-threo-aldose 1-dehydrogenase